MQSPYTIKLVILGKETGRAFMITRDISKFASVILL